MSAATCHQKLVRDRKAREAYFPVDLFDVEPAVDISIEHSEVREVSYGEAASIILDYEWLGTMPAQLHKAVGLFLDEKLSAVECFSATRPAGEYVVEGKPAVCLARGACAHWCPPWAASRLISKSLSFLDAERFWFCVAYSDTDAGEIGTVYQASNWTCLGPVSRGNKYWVDPTGKRYDHERPRSVARSRDPNFKAAKRIDPKYVEEVKREMVKDGWEHVEGGVRYRYAMPLARSRHQRRQRQAMLDSVRCDYPTRAALREEAP